MTDLASSVPVALSLAWRPFLDPLDLQDHWFWLLVPLSLGVSMTYKAVRLQSLEHYWRKVLIMTAQLIIAIIAMGAAAFLVVEYVLPIILPME